MKLLLTMFSCLVLLGGCTKDNNSLPTAEIAIFPKVADTSSFIRFDGSGSRDLETPVEMLQFRWDFTGDGIWDTEFKRDPVAIWQYTETGTYQPKMEVRDGGGLLSRTTKNVYIRLNFVRSSLTDARDGHRYRTVLIDDLWWMAENLRYGVAISPTSEPLDNGIAEMFMQDSQKFDQKLYGGYYTWGELTNYHREIENGICPPGWRLMTIKDWRTLERFPRSGDGEFYLKLGGYVGLDLFTAGAFRLDDWQFHSIDTTGVIWVSDYRESGTFPSLVRSVACYNTQYYGAWWDEGFSYQLDKDFWKHEWGDKMDFKQFAFNVRCVKKWD